MAEKGRLTSRGMHVCTHIWMDVSIYEYKTDDMNTYFCCALTFKLVNEICQKAFGIRFTEIIQSLTETALPTLWPLV